MRDDPDTARVLLVALSFLPACATYHAVWKKDAACAIVCDYRQGYMSTAITLDPWTCRCWTPQLAELNDGRQIPLDFPGREVRCPGGCEAEAAAIVACEPWRKPASADLSKE